VLPFSNVDRDQEQEGKVCVSLGVMEIWYESYEVWLSVIWWGEEPDVVNSHVVMKGKHGKDGTDGTNPSVGSGFEGRWRVGL